MPRDSKPRKHKFAVGQVVYWGNGFDRYVRIQEQLPLHCNGGCFSYSVRAASAWHVEAMGRYANGFTEGPVSEEVLRKLTAQEIGRKP